MLRTLLISACLASALQAAPNVVMIISDDQAWNDYSFMGHPHIKTPHIDKLAEQSLTFTRGYVPDSLCRPSLASMISGLYPHQHRISGNDPKPANGKRPWNVKKNPQYDKLREKLISHIDTVPSLPRILAKQGYMSHQSGKWWEGNFSRGGFTAGMTRGFPQPGGRHGDDGLKIGREGLKPVFDFIDTAQKAKRPFFIWYAPFLPHSPHNPPERILKKYISKTDSIHQARYWAMCEWFDETCGELLGYLDRQKLSENTIVIYVCDNGWIQRPDKKSYALRSKRSPYDGGVRTPIMIRWPGKVKPKMDRKTLVNSIDIAPTILQACQVKPHAEMTGVNLLDAQQLEKRKAIFGEVFEHDVVDIDRPAASLNYRWCVEGDWKLILPSSRLPKEKPELFNVTLDPYEKKELSAEHQEIVQKMTTQINNWWPGK